MAKGKTCRVKSKTRKSISKRFKITASGKVLRRRAGKRHLMRKKNRNKKRKLGQPAVLAKSCEKSILKSLPFA